MSKLLIPLVAILCLIESHPVFAFDAPDYFDKKCSSCHSIGGGDDVGPDLKGVTERRDEKWLVNFIRDSEKVIASGDPVANEMFAKFKNKKMPAQELSDEEIKYILAFIKTGKGTTASAYRQATQANPYDIATGLQLFIGMKKLENGGPACFSCHGAGPHITEFGGGTLGPDLVTKSYGDYQDKGLNKVLSKISFPTMTAIYSPAPLTEQENYYLRAFLGHEHTKYEQAEDSAHEKGDPKNNFVILGMGVAVLGLLGADVVFRNRRKKTKKPY